MSFRTQRVRDPVHGLIVFREGVPVDELAWRLLDAAEFQRLRRIKQLGVSEFVYPGATHTRLAHCIGVFHTARKLLEVIRREIGPLYNEQRAEIALIAALLHDVGHGPFSHTFEEVQKSRNVKKRHELWTADIIENPDGELRTILEAHRTGFASEVATLLKSENPSDIYHAVVSSSFDADRLDYLRRDRMMTGTGAGAIDFDWLLEHVRIDDVNIEADDDTDGAMVPTFCLDLKALPAAEQFLLSRYTLHEQVYFHKATRCIEQMIASLLRKVASASSDPGEIRRIGLRPEHPLVSFFAEASPSVTAYLRLDDAVVLSAFGEIAMTETEEGTLARRLRDRKLYKTLDVRRFGPDTDKQLVIAKKIDQRFKDQIAGDAVLKDSGAKLSIYTQVGGDDEKSHKKLRILDGDKIAREITSLSEIVKDLAQPKVLTRYYFSSESDRDAAKALG